MIGNFGKDRWELYYPWHRALVGVCCLSDDVVLQEDHRMTHLPLNGTERHTANICRKTVQVSVNTEL